MRKKKKGILPIENVLVTIIFILAIFVPISVVFSQASYAKSNIEVEKANSKVNKQIKINQSLSMQVDELASLSNIQKIAKESGLSYNNERIIVIDK